MAYSYDDYGWYDDGPEYGSVWGDDESRYFGGHEYDDMPSESVEDETWLDRNYGGAPDECSWHFIHVEIVKLVNGECPRQGEHTDGIHYDDGIPF